MFIDMDNAASCVNNEGSYEYAGYTEAAGGISVEDIDEWTAAIDGCNI